jgi:hypothetical protein
MDENHQNKTESKRATSRDKSQLPAFSPQNVRDEKEAQDELSRLRKRLRENEKSAFKTNYSWTGFKNKTLWDWLQLLGILAIPLILGIATLLFSIQQAHLADIQHQSDQKLAQQQHQSDQQQALDQQRQATLVAYQENIRDLLLHQGLLTSKPDDAVRVIARTETLSTMRQLDAKRNNYLVQFLQDAGLIGEDLLTLKDHNIINFINADMSDTLQLHLFGNRLH